MGFWMFPDDPLKITFQLMTAETAGQVQDLLCAKAAVPVVEKTGGCGDGFPWKISCPYGC